MRTVGVVSVGRSDYGIYLPVLRAIAADPQLQLRIYASGAHLSPEFGSTVRQFAADGFTVDERVEMLLSADTPAAIATSMGLGTIGFAQLLGRARPDILLVLGDRFEMHAAALAALPFNLPIAHIHGGEVTEGAIDEALRHSLTKLCHLHFVSTAAYGRRVVQLGEEPWRVIVSGAPALDHLATQRPLEPAAFLARFGFELPPEFLLVTYHPVTREYDQAEWQFEQLLAALAAQGAPVIFTLANADTNGRAINAQIARFVEQHPWAHAVANFGPEAYAGAMRRAAAMVGNSSSGIIEAATFALPVVNIGTRQQGRARGPNVIDVGNAADAIADGLRRALDPAFRTGLRGMANPYGDGRAAERIVRGLRDTPLDARLLMKRFYDLPAAPGPQVQHG